MWCAHRQSRLGRPVVPHYLEDLRQADVRERLMYIWSDPLSLDLAREAARISSPFARSYVVEAGTRERWRGHHVSGDTAALQARAGSVIYRKKRVM